MSLTIKQKATNNDTYEHIHRVQYYLNKCITVLLNRAYEHDQSKLRSPEVEIFTEYTPKLAGTTFGSEEYNKYKEEMKVALEHHYANNRHHPEYHKNGIEDMNLLDLIEMFCDWKAASERHNDGNIRKSIEYNADRFDFPTTLRKIFENTVETVEK